MIRIIITLTLTLLVFFTLYFLLPLVQVIGDSMLPTYFSGEILIGTKLYRKSKLKKGEVIVYHSPTDGKIVIKRIHKIEKTINGDILFYCLGDNSEHSYDSRNYGYVSSKKLICKIIDQRGE